MKTGKDENCFLVEALKDSEKRYRLLVENSGEAIIVAQDGFLKYVNPMAEHTFSYSKDYLRSTPFVDIVHPEYRKTIIQDYIKILGGEKLTPRYTTIRATTADGSEKWLEFNGILFEWEKKPAVLGFVRDITDRRNAGEEIIKRDALLQKIFDLLPVGLWIADEKGTLLRGNPEGIKIWGAEPCVGQNEYRVFKAKRYPSGEEIAPHDWALAHSVNEGVTVVNEMLEIENFNSKKKIILNYTAPVIDDKGKIKGAIVVNQDITERKQAEQKLADYTLQLERLYRQLHEEIDKARQLHERTLPKSIPSIPGLSFAAHYKPAQKLGGDFYDVIRKGSKLIFYLSDVSGHGLDGAMLSVFVKHTIKGYLTFSPVNSISPAKILHYLTTQFAQESYPEEYFICIFLVVLDLENMELTYSGAGFQDRPLVQLGNGKKLNLAIRGLFITSYLPNNLMKFQEESISLTPGTTIFFNTDGLTEQGAKGAYYMDRLSGVFYENAHLDPQLIADAVTEDFRDFNNGSLQGKDDITYLVLQVDPVKKEIHHLELTSDFDGLKNLQEFVYRILPNFKESGMFKTCLIELAANAIEHGNRFDPKKIVSVEITILEGHIHTTVQDQGEGFSWREKVDRPLELDGKEDRGRGIAMTKICCDRLVYNEKGNRVSFTVTTSEGGR